MTLTITIFGYVFQISFSRQLRVPLEQLKP